jgi:hypothetical protein
MKRYQILNILADYYNLNSYLEIGVQDVKQNFNKIQCAKRIGVDPEVDHPLVFKCTSDDFFKKNVRKFDLIFIDGLHEYNQVKRDLLNSLLVLNERGFVVLHDTLPTEESKATFPRETKEWFGDVYKLVLELHSIVPFVTINTDCGVTICWNGQTKAKKPVPLNWESYIKHKDYLNVKQPNDVDFRHIRK